MELDHNMQEVKNNFKEILIDKVGHYIKDNIIKTQLNKLFYNIVKIITIK